MFGRFFAFEMGCPEEDSMPGSRLNNPEIIAFLNEDGSISESPNQSSDQNFDQTPELGPDGMPMICECRGLGCKKCKRKKAQVITLTGKAGPVPVMNMTPMRMPMAPWSMGQIMLNKRTF